MTCCFWSSSQPAKAARTTWTNTRSITVQSLHWRLGFGLLRTVGRLVGHYGAEAVSRGHRSTPFNRQQDRNRAENSVSHREVLLIQVAALEDVLDAQLDLPGRSGIRLQDPREILRVEVAERQVVMGDVQHVEHLQLHAQPTPFA